MVKSEIKVFVKKMFLSIVKVFNICLIASNFFEAANSLKSKVIGRAIGEVLDTLFTEFPSKILIINMNKNNSFLEDIQNEVLRWSGAPAQIYNFRAREKYNV